VFGLRLESVTSNSRQSIAAKATCSVYKHGILSTETLQPWHLGEGNFRQYKLQLLEHLTEKDPEG
jgi:hypothetical protein